MILIHDFYMVNEMNIFTNIVVINFVFFLGVIGTERSVLYSIIERTPFLNKYVFNGWIALTVISVLVWFYLIIGIE